MTNQRPAENEYAAFYAGYVRLVPESDVLGVLDRQRDEVRAMMDTVAPDREAYRYEPAKWSIREVIGHVVDGERVFGHRAFCFSRGEKAALPGFDEKAYAARSPYDRCRLADLVREFAIVRDANLTILQRLSDDEWSLSGTASSASVTVRALAFIMAGHVRHHLGVLRSRYGFAA